MFDKMKQMMEVRKQADRIKRELEAMDVEVDEVPGIRITVSGSQTFKSISVDESMLADKDRLEAELLRGVNAAVKESQKVAAEKMKEVTGMNMPGM